jgi:hypothetical protein
MGVWMADIDNIFSYCQGSLSATAMAVAKMTVDVMISYKITCGYFYKPQFLEKAIIAMR